MTPSYPTIALGSTGFLLTIPSPTGGPGHTLCIPETLAGLAAIRRALRKLEEAQRPQLLGMQASPTQHMVEEWMKNRASIEAEDRREESAKKFAELSLDLDL